MDGIINIYKERGFTSFDVVAILRKKFKTKKIGHTGTLDPDAEGVLPVCIGRATKVADYLTEKTKVYRAQMRLGIETDTQDATGAVLAEKTVHCTPQEIEAAILAFVGPYDQIPPMYSAIKVNGQKLYDLARAGKTIERASRPITILAIEDIRIEADRISMTVTCSKGTYIRTLCHDIGQRLGCGAHMTELLRLRSGSYSLETALKLSQLDPLIESGEIDRYIQPIDAVFSDYAAFTVEAAYDKWLLNGNKLQSAWLTTPAEIEIGRRYRIYDHRGGFIGLYHGIEMEEGPGLKPTTLFF